MHLQLADFTMLFRILVVDDRTTKFGHKRSLITFKSRYQRPTTILGVDRCDMVM